MNTHTTYLRWSILGVITITAFFIVTSFLNVLTPAYAAVSTTHIVSEGESIQAAIDGAAVGDTVLVQAGSYTESLLLDKAVNLTGVNSRTTILNGPLNERVLSVTAGLDTSTVISGFTIQHGGRGISPADGGGIHLHSSPLLSHLIITGNAASVQGGGILATADLHLQYSFAQDNNAIFGAAILAVEDLYMTHTTVLTHADINFAVVAVIGETSIKNSQMLYGLNASLFVSQTAFIIDSEFAYNGKAIASDFGADIHVMSSTIHHNQGGGGANGGGIATSGSVYLTNTAVLHNVGSGNGGGVYAGHDLYVYSSTIMFNHASSQYYSDPTKSGYGGGAYIGRHGHIEHSQISSNTANNDGGGLYISVTLFLSDTVVTYNEGASGGGIRGDAADLHLIDCTIAHNKAETQVVGSATIYAYGGAFWSAAAIVERCSFSNNSASIGYEGVVVNSELTMTNSLIQQHDHTGPLRTAPVVFSHGLLSNTQVINNRGGAAGIVIHPHYYDLAEEAFIVNSRVENNHVQYGALFIENSRSWLATDRVWISNTQLISNTADTYASGITVLRHDAAELFVFVDNVLIDNRDQNQSAPAIYVSGGDVLLRHVTIASDALLPQAAIYVSPTTQITLLNSIVASYTMAVQADDNFGLVYVDYNLFSGSDLLSGAFVVDGGHNLTDTNPLFVGPYDYRLAAGSPAIDAAAPSAVSVDILGNPRPGFGSSLPDIGAYECDASPELTDFSAMLAGGSVQWNWSGGDDYRLWGTGVPYQAVSGEGQLLTDATFTDSVSDMTAYFYTLSPLSNCGVTAETPNQFGVFPFSLTAGS